MPISCSSNTRAHHAPLSVKGKNELARDLRENISRVACTPYEILTSVVTASAYAFIGGGVALGMQAVGVCDTMRTYTNDSINAFFSDGCDMFLGENVDNQNAVWIAGCLVGGAAGVAAIIELRKPSNKIPRKCIDPDPCGIKEERERLCLEKSAKMSRSLLAEPSLSPLGVKPRIQ